MQWEGVWFVSAAIERRRHLYIYKLYAIETEDFEQELKEGEGRLF